MVGMKKWILFALILIISGYVFAQQKRITRAEYLAQYCDLAVKEMKRTGIPASITLAQACLESDDGNSTLAREANNHFGIKCHNTWTGEKMYQDDDEKGECFRKYTNAKESFKDHSEFLAKAKRYSSLFQLDPYDYKAWAKGLKDAGYATNPKYPEYLIKIIEDNKLYEFDKGIRVHHIDADSSSVRKPREKKNRQSLTDPDNFNISLGGYDVKLNNRVKYIFVKSGDTPDQLARSLDMFAWEILRYNDLTKDSLFHDKQLIYIQPKRNKAEFGKNTHTVKEGETLYSISQFYAVKLNKLIRKNNLVPDYKTKAGEILYLRTRKPLEK
jgi:LysM repeat protein